MKRHNALIAILLILTLMPVPVQGSNFMTPITETLKLKETLKVDKSDYYSFDSKDGFFTGEPILVKVANAVFSFHKLCVYGLIRILSWSFDFSAMDWFGDILDDTMKPLKLVLYDSFFNVVVVALFTWLLLMFALLKRKTKFWSSFMASIAIVAVGMGFLSSPSYYLRLADDVVQEITDDIVSEVFVRKDDANTVHGAVGNISEMLWEVFVEDNWKYINFGSMSDADEHSKEFLAFLPRSKERIDLIKDVAKENSFIEGEHDGWRLGLVLGTSLMSAIPILVLMLLSLIAVGSKIVAAIYALWAPIVFILAILPMFGLRTFLRWFQKEGGFLGIFILVFLMITLLLIFFNEVNKKTDGIMDAMLIINAIIVTLIIFRKHLLDFLVSAQYGDKGMKRGMKRSEGRNSMGYRAIDSISDRIQRGGRKAGDYALAGAGALGHGSLEVMNDYVAKPIVNAAGETAKAATGGIAGAAVGGYEASRDGFSNRRERKEQRAAAEEYLRQAYDKERHAAEEAVRPDDFGEVPRPEYTEYILGKMKNEELGKNLFTNKEINDVVMELNQIEKNGGTKEDLFRSLEEDPSEVRDEIHRPSFSDDELEKWREERNIEILGMDDDLENTKPINKPYENMTEDELASTYLDLKYEKDKTEAEDTAKRQEIRTNQTVNPVYNGQTKVVMNRESKGQQKFDASEISQAKEELSSLRRQGTDTFDYLRSLEPKVVEGQQSSTKEESVNSESEKTESEKINFRVPKSEKATESEKESNPRAFRNENDDVSGYEPMGEGIPANDQVLNEEIMAGFRSDMAAHQQEQTNQVNKILETDLHEKVQIDEIHDKMDTLQKETERIQHVVKNTESPEVKQSTEVNKLPEGNKSPHVKPIPVRRKEIPNYNGEES